MHRDRSWLSPVGGLCIVAFLVWRIGAGPFVDAVRHLDAGSVALASAIALVTTVCGAWRWVLVARGLGAELTLRSAVSESYRSQFLNVTLPGGVLGDVHRGVRHGRDGGDLGRGLRSVVWERSAGQVVLAVVTGIVLLVVPVTSEMRSGTGVLVLSVAAVLLGAALVVVLVRSRIHRPDSRVVRVVRAVSADLGAGVLGRRTWPGVLGSSTAVVVGHAATFVVAARAAGVTAPTTRLLPLALVVLVAMSLPLNVAGWGPREGAAAWAFGAAGLGAAAGVGTAVVYGVMVLVSSLPGAVVLALGRRDGTRSAGLACAEGVAGG
jgi:uncharacterized membrane protein YbhN (UPF0104 family)